jgi:hypothetical protein
MLNVNSASMALPVVDPATTFDECRGPHREGDNTFDRLDFFSVADARFHFLMRAGIAHNA